MKSKKINIKKGKDNKSWFGKITITDKIAILILYLGFLGFLFLPFLATQKDWVQKGLDISYRNLDPNEIGDMIGGIVGPFIALISATLVYLTIREQIKANKSIQKQFKKEKKERYEKAIFDEVVQGINEVVQEIKNIKGTSLSVNFQSLNNNEKISKIAYASIFDSGNLNHEFVDYSEIVVFKTLFKKFVESLKLFCTNIEHNKAFYKIVELKNYKINEYIDSSSLRVRKFNDTNTGKYDVSNLCKLEYLEMFDYFKILISLDKKIKFEKKKLIENNNYLDEYRVFFEIVDFLNEYKIIIKKFEDVGSQSASYSFSKAKHGYNNDQLKNFNNEHKIIGEQFIATNREMNKFLQDFCKKEVIIKDTFVNYHNKLVEKISNKYIYFPPFNKLLHNF